VSSRAVRARPLTFFIELSHFPWGAEYLSNNAAILIGRLETPGDAHIRFHIPAQI